MKILRLLSISCLMAVMLSCNSSQNDSPPEPHLELGQRITFVGANPEKVYLVAGYRNQLEDKTDTNWNKQGYIVFTYFDDQGDYVQGVVHKNAILKR
jgi:hypothetical protein